MTKMPRIQKVAATGSSTLKVKWKGGPTEVVELAGWIATGGDILAPLQNSRVFGKPFVDDYGSVVAWDEGDLRIDAVHLEQLVCEQRPFGAHEAAQWQQHMGLSNHEAASLLGIAVSTWNGYKSDGRIPMAVAMLCRAATRDPILMQAHLRPRRSAGRPRKTA
jgi:hypothetical protein